MRKATKGSMFLFEVGKYKSISEIFLPVYMSSERKKKSHYERAENEKQRNGNKTIRSKDFRHLVTIFS